MKKNMEQISKKTIKAIELHKSGNLLEAKKNYLEVLENDPDNHQIKRLLALIEYSTKNYSTALMLLNDCIKLNDQDSEALANRGMVNLKLKNLTDAENDYKKSIEIDDNINGLFNYANLLKEKKDYNKSIQIFNRVLKKNPNFYKAYNNIGMIQSELGEYENAIKNFDSALEIKNDYGNALFCKSINQLLLGNYTEGWKNYEWRWKTPIFDFPKRDFIQPYWNGSDDLSNKTILIHGEQGLGDHFQYIRYLELIKKKAKKVVLEVDKRLVIFLKESQIHDEVYARGEKLPFFDYHCPLMSLPLKFSTTLENIVAHKEYLTVKPERQKKWESFFDKNKVNIGIAWEVNKDVQVKDRSIAVENFYELSKIKNVSLYSLQKYDSFQLQDNLNFEIKNFGKNFDEEAPFLDTGAIIKNLDLVISVDTSIVHLSAALGCKTYLILSNKPHWTWQLKKKKTPWYPTIEIYRQNINKDWKSVFNEIKSDLIKYFDEKVNS